MKINALKRVYKTPKAEVILLDNEMTVLMSSGPVIPDASINGNGLQFTEDNGSW